MKQWIWSLLFVFQWVKGGSPSTPDTALPVLMEMGECQVPLLCPSSARIKRKPLHIIILLPIYLMCDNRVWWAVYMVGELKDQDHDT